MTLAELLNQPLPDLATLRGLFVVFPGELLAECEAAQADATSFRVHPIGLDDGRFALRADLLSEIGPGGVFASSFAKLDAEKFDQVEILELSEIADVWPQPEGDL